MAYCCVPRIFLTPNAWWRSRSGRPSCSKPTLRLPVNIAIYAEWRKQVTSFEQVGIARASVFNLTGSGQPEQVRGALVSSTIFPVFGVQPRSGEALRNRKTSPGTIRW